jgi:hypothetical protein
MAVSALVGFKMHCDDVTHDPTTRDSLLFGFNNITRTGNCR